MMERFHPDDVAAFADMWYYRNWGASLCIERFGCIMGFAIVVDNKLEYLIVHPCFEGQGLGQTLVSYVIEQLREQDYPSVHLLTADNPLLCGWYGRQGFEVSSARCDAAGISGEVMVYRFRPLRKAAKEAKRRLGV